MSSVNLFTRWFWSTPEHVSTWKPSLHRGVVEAVSEGNINPLCISSTDVMYHNSKVIDTHEAPKRVHKNVVWYHIRKRLKQRRERTIFLSTISQLETTGLKSSVPLLTQDESYKVYIDGLRSEMAISKDALCKIDNLKPVSRLRRKKIFADRNKRIILTRVYSTMYAGMQNFRYRDKRYSQLKELFCNSETFSPGFRTSWDTSWDSTSKRMEVAIQLYFTAINSRMICFDNIYLLRRSDIKIVRDLVEHRFDNIELRTLDEKSEEEIVGLLLAHHEKYKR
jgi:hypothetical protein